VSTTAPWPQSAVTGRWGQRIATALLVATLVYWVLGDPTPVELVTFAGVFVVVFALADSLVRRLLSGSP
jgi:membrane protein implicated in regulation of membrane protease activity